MRLPDRFALWQWRRNLNHHAYMDFTEAALLSDGATAGDTPAADFILYAEAVSRDRQLSRVFYIPIAGIDDHEELNIPVEETGQHELIAPWVEFFRYCGATVELLESKSAYRLRAETSWHDLLLKKFPAKTKVAIQDDEIWEELSTVSVLLIERSSNRVINGTTQASPSLKGEI